MFIISIIIQCTIKKIALISRISLFTIGNHVFISSYMCRYYIFVNSLLLYFLSLKCFKGALSWYGKLTWESAHALNLIILCLLIVWGMTFIFMVQLNFLCHSIANLWRHVWYHYNTLGYPVIIISKVIDISWYGRRNVILNNYIIDKFVGTINGCVCIRIVGGHSFLWDGTLIFNCIFCIQSNLELKFLHVAVFVKIPFQHINFPYMLRICRQNFMKFKDR